MQLLLSARKLEHRLQPYVGVMGSRVHKALVDAMESFSIFFGHDGSTKTCIIAVRVGVLYVRFIWVSSGSMLGITDAEAPMLSIGAQCCNKASILNNTGTMEVAKFWCLVRCAGDFGLGTPVVAPKCGEPMKTVSDRTSGHHLQITLGTARKKHTCMKLPETNPGRLLRALRRANGLSPR